VAPVRVTHLRVFKKTELEASYSSATRPPRRPVVLSIGGFEVTHKNKVLRSFNNEGATLCVDIFVRPNGTIGFEEYRRDLEDNR
jgi:hypothetical protein